MKGLEKIELIGNVVADAVINEANGKKVINFRIAVNKEYKDAQGVKVARANYYSGAYWRRAGESTEVAKYLLKGVPVFIEGEPEVDVFTNKNGEAAASIKVHVRNIILLGSGKDGNSSNQSSQTAHQYNVKIKDNPPVGEVNPPFQGSPDESDDLPF